MTFNKSEYIQIAPSYSFWAMPKLLLSNSNSISSADFIIVGVPDESKSHAKRSGYE